MSSGSDGGPRRRLRGLEGSRILHPPLDAGNPTRGFPPGGWAICRPRAARLDADWRRHSCTAGRRSPAAVSVAAVTPAITTDQGGFVRTMRSRILPVALLLLLGPRLPAPSGAQTPAPGTRVRVSVRNATPAQRVGTLVSLGRDTLKWRAERDTTIVSVPVLALARLETSAGFHRHTVKGLLIGAATGVGLGVTIGLASGDDPKGQFLRFKAGEKAVAAGTVLGLAGTAIGAGIGWAVRSERWMPVTLQRITAFRMVPTTAGVQLRVMLRP